MIDWVKSNLKGKSAQDAIETIKNEEITGADLVDCKTADEIKDYGIPQLAANRMFRGLKKAFPHEFAVAPAAPAAPGNGNGNNSNSQSNAKKKAKTVEERLEENERKRRTSTYRNNFNNNSNNNNNNNYNNNYRFIFNRNNNANNRFQVSVSLGGGVRKLTKNTFTVNSTVADLKQEIANNEIGGNADAVRLIYKTRHLQDGKTLGECGITGSHCFVTSVISLNGGSVSEDEKQSVEKKQKMLDNGKNSDTRDRLPRFKENKNIKPSDEPDCITFEDSDDELRVKMPCGHVFGALTIFKWCQS